MMDTIAIPDWTGVKSTKEMWEANEAATGGKIDDLLTGVNQQVEDSYTDYLTSINSNFTSQNTLIDNEKQAVIDTLLTVDTQINSSQQSILQAINAKFP